MKISPLILSIDNRWGVSSQFHAMAITSPLPTAQEAGWAPYRVWTILEQRETSFNHLHSKPAPRYDIYIGTEISSSASNDGKHGQLVGGGEGAQKNLSLSRLTGPETRIRSCRKTQAEANCTYKFYNKHPPHQLITDA